MKRFLIVIFLFSVQMLVACGGGDAEDPDVISGVVNAPSEMTGLMLILYAADQHEVLSFVYAGKFQFRMSRGSNQRYRVEIFSQAKDGECSINNASGRWPSETSNYVEVNCRLNQQISWPQDHTPSENTVLLAATASSKLPVSFVDRTAASQASACRLEGNLLTYLSSGASCTIAATQAGNVYYFAAPEVTQDFKNPN